MQKLPALQFVHIEEDVADTVGLNVPRGHLESIPATQYAPIGHAKHSDELGEDCWEYVPSGHSAGSEDPSGQKEPAGHLMQSAEKSTTMNSLNASKLVPTETFPEKGTLELPVTSCPFANVMICAPAGSAAPAVVHTMVRVAGVMAHPDNVAEPDAGVSVPPGVARPVK